MTGFHAPKPTPVRATVVNRSPTRRVKGKRSNPEFSLQVAIIRYIERALPPEVLFTASNAGIYTGKLAAMKAKASGVRKGWPDLQFLYPDGVTRYIEVKVEGGRLSPEQRFFYDAARATAAAQFAPISVVCRSLEDVSETLAAWAEATGTHLKAVPLTSPIFKNTWSTDDEQL